MVGSQFTKGKVWLKQSFWSTGLIVAFWFTLDLVLNVSSSSFFSFNRVMGNVRKTQHQNPEFGHTQGEIQKNLQKVH
jgi:hypothetical protein